MVLDRLSRALMTSCPLHSRTPSSLAILARVADINHRVSRSISAVAGPQSRGRTARLSGSESFTRGHTSFLLASLCYVISIASTVLRQGLREVRGSRGSVHVYIY